MPLAQQPNNIVFPPVNAFPDCDFRTAAPGHSITSSARLLRAHRQRPRSRAAEQGDELATDHSITSSVFNASTESELDAAFARIVQQRIGTLLGASDPFLFNRRDQVVSLAARHGIPSMYYLRDFAHAGGLMAYGNSLTDMYRLVGVYVGRILKGEKPTDLPVVQSTKFEFVINLQTARALGIEVPNSMQLLADEVIE
jgi:putative ABC transport system substrate-binding protein